MRAFDAARPVAPLPSPPRHGLYRQRQRPQRRRASNGVVAQDISVVAAIFDAQDTAAAGEFAGGASRAPTAPAIRATGIPKLELGTRTRALDSAEFERRWLEKRKA